MYSWINERLATVSRKINREYLTVLAADGSEKKKETYVFFNDLQKAINNGQQDHLIIGGDFNSRIGKTSLEHNRE